MNSQILDGLIEFLTEFLILKTDGDHRTIDNGPAQESGILIFGFTSFLPHAMDFPQQPIRDLFIRDLHFQIGNVVCARFDISYGQRSPLAPLN
jgi:hypothetical protein